MLTIGKRVASATTGTSTFSGSWRISFGTADQL